MPQVQQKPIIHGRDHMAGGADPIPGMGGGIQFDTYPQAGQWLYVETDGTDTSPSGFGMEFFDNTDNGINLTSGTGPAPSVDIGGFGSGAVNINNGQAVFEKNGDVSIGGLDASFRGQTVEISSNILGGTSITLDPGGVATRTVVLENDGDLTITWDNIILTLAATTIGAQGATMFQLSDASLTPVLQVKIPNVGGTPPPPEYHILTGATWVADL